MTLLSPHEIEILKTYLTNLKKEEKTLKRILNNIAKQYESQFKLLNDIIQCQENIKDYKQQYYIITTYNKDIGSHILKQIDQTYSHIKTPFFQKIQKQFFNKKINFNNFFLKKHIYNNNN